MMEKFENVTVLTKGNIYFDGKVQSRTVLFPDGGKKTLGVILPGDYEFGTADREVMEMTAGVATASLILLVGSAVDLVRRLRAPSPVPTTAAG